MQEVYKFLHIPSATILGRQCSQQYQMYSFSSIVRKLTTAVKIKSIKKD